ncbi:pirin family protein [Sphaerotilus mobilis]|uniref:Redox-sensitive bicupin YhaK (Pirin superfamily) n=1 Tax=Sphaerotilus mobilis TaxID=47994 RepID=A0A4Q7LPL7_9BURK|nr:pirin family protein [Sphaerotilus mobilis]RZS56666.1 redox-sensitive bicupin YhaK (pirin superfamily) [Sphaerotilus mobilis]
MTSDPTPTAHASRTIVHRTRGTTHGPITRLMSPGDLGRVLKPFIFLDLVNFQPGALGQGFGMHPHSGIATLTFMTEGDVRYEDTTGQAGILPAGGVEWMRAGGGVWHTGAPVGDTAGRGFQLWVALPAALELATAVSRYLAPEQVPVDGPARVLLGHHGAAQAVIEAPSDMSYLSVRLGAGMHWRYVPPTGHTVAWVAVATGQLTAGEPIDAGELVVFEPSGAPIDFQARADTSFVLGSAVAHPHDLVMGSYSVHTNRLALAQGTAEIRRIGQRLREAGRLD